MTLILAKLHEPFLVSFLRRNDIEKKSFFFKKKNSFFVFRAEKKKSSFFEKMSLLIGDLVEYEAQAYMVWSTSETDSLVRVISLCAEKTFSLPTEKLTLMTATANSDCALQKDRFVKGDIVNFKAEHNHHVGLVCSAARNSYMIQREIYTEVDGKVVHSCTMCVPVDEKDILQHSCPLVQTIFRAEHNARIFKAVALHRKKANNSREKAKLFFDEAEEMRMKVEDLTSKYEEEKEEATFRDESAIRMLDDLI
jgi:hypothetical protein